MKFKLLMACAVSFLFLSAASLAADCATADCADSEMTAREMQEKIAEQQEQIDTLECQMLMKGNIQLCFDNLPLCTKRYMRCRGVILKEKVRKNPGMYREDGRWDED